MSRDPARTSVEESLLDLASEASEDTVVAAITRAFALRKTTPGRLLSELTKRTRQAKRGLVDELCGAGLRGIESVLEYRFHKLVITAHRLPEPARQARLSPGTRTDAWYQEYGVILELDGRLGHERSHRDMRRDNRHALLGAALTLRYGWHDTIHRPCDIAREVAQALRQRGWPGQTIPCRRCHRLQ